MLAMMLLVSCVRESNIMMSACVSFSIQTLLITAPSFGTFVLMSVQRGQFILPCSQQISQSAPLIILRQVSIAIGKSRVSGILTISMRSFHSFGSLKRVSLPFSMSTYTKLYFSASLPAASVLPDFGGPYSSTFLYGLCSTVVSLAIFVTRPSF